MNSTYKYENDGWHTETRIDGSKRCQYTIISGNLHGTRNCFHPNGQIWIQEVFDNGQFNGINTSFTDTGDTVFVEKYQHDTLMYTRNFDYHKNGRVKSISTIHYIDDSTLTENPFKMKKGLWRRSINIRYTEQTISNWGWFVLYDENGALSDSIEIENGIYSGLHTTFYPSGKTKIQVHQLNGEYEGGYMEYFESGQIKIETTYSEGKRNGTYKEFDETGKLQEESTYGLGKKKKS